jgi:hypothetical protein
MLPQQQINNRSDYGLRSTANTVIAAQESTVDSYQKGWHEWTQLLCNLITNNNNDDA